MEMVVGAVVEGEQALVEEEQLAMVSRLVPAVFDPSYAPPQTTQETTQGNPLQSADLATEYRTQS